MARITVEDCLEIERNRFALVQLSSRRTKQLLHGARPVIADVKGNKAVVISLREIAEGVVEFMTVEEDSFAKQQEEGTITDSPAETIDLPASKPAGRESNSQTQIGETGNSSELAGHNAVMNGDSLI